MSKQTLQKAFILHRHPYGETSFLVELFTEQSGRIGVIAKGVKSPKSKFRYVLEPFITLMVFFREKSELPTLQTAEMIHSAPHLKKTALFCGLYVNELLMYLLHRHDTNPEIFGHYERLLQNLHRISEHDRKNLAIALRVFEKSLLSSLGYGLELTKEARSQKPITKDQHYTFSPPTGFVNARSGGQQRGFVFSGESLLAIAADDYSSNEALQNAKRITRLMFQFLLQGKTIESRKLVIIKGN